MRLLIVVKILYRLPRVDVSYLANVKLAKELRERVRVNEIKFKK